jgi:hypothetical protein
MTVYTKSLRGAKYAENAETTQYTAGTGVRTIIDKFTATNVTAGAVTLTVKIVDSGGTASADETIISAKSIAAGETYTCPEMTGQVLNAGDFISTIAGAATSIVIRISGRENT